MSDERLRELERRWRASRAPEDEVAWLAERVRVGELPQSRLEIAALCGYRPAKSAWDVLSPGPLSSAELVQLLSVSTRHLAEWRRQGMPASKVGGRLAYELSSVLTWLADRREGTGPGERQPLEWFATFVEARSYEAALRVLALGIRLLPHDSADLNARMEGAWEELERPPAERDQARLTRLRDGLAYGSRTTRQWAMARALKGWIDGMRHGPSRLRAFPTQLAQIMDDLPELGRTRLPQVIRSELVPWLLGS